MSNEVAKTQATAVATQSNQTTLKAFIQGNTMKSELQKVLPKNIDVAKFIAVSLSQLGKNPKLGNCSQLSFYNCIMASARIGIIPDGRNAYLIPYGNECTLQFDYKGLISLIKRGGNIIKARADVICENDEFEYDMGDVKRHSYRLGNRGAVVGAYAEVTYKNGDKQYEVMDINEINKVKSKSRSGSSGPWVEFFNEMAKKVVFKRLTKWLELSPEMIEALNMDNEEMDFRTHSAEINHSGNTVVQSITSLSSPAHENQPIDVNAVENNKEELPFD